MVKPLGWIVALKYLFHIGLWALYWTRHLTSQVSIPVCLSFNSGLSCGTREDTRRHQFDPLRKKLSLPILRARAYYLSLQNPHLKHYRIQRTYSISLISKRRKSPPDKIWIRYWYQEEDLHLTKADSASNLKTILIRWLWSFWFSSNWKGKLSWFESDWPFSSVKLS